jgi:cobalt/nickel transport system permease protein
LLRDIVAISRASRISDRSPISKLIAFLLPPIILSFDRTGIASSLVNLGVSLLIIRRLGISFKVYVRFLKGISLFLLMGSVLVSIESGAYSGLLLMARGVSSAGSIYLFAATTPLEDLFNLMGRSSITREIAEIGKSMLRFMIVVEDEFRKTKTAMESRLGLIGWKSSVLNSGKVAGAVFRGILRDWRDIEDSLKSRGYRGKPVFLERRYSPSIGIFFAGTIYNLGIIFIIIKTRGVV